MNTMHGPRFEDARVARLQQFVRLDLAITLFAAAVMVIINVAFVGEFWLTVATAMVLIAAAAMAMALRPLSRGSMARGVMWLAAGNWAIAIGGAAIATFSWPVQALAALLPAVVAGPYVSRARYRVILTVSSLVSVVSSGLGLLQDVTGLTDRLPGWVPPTVLVIFMPFMAVLMALGGAGAAATLRELLDESLTANDQLRTSEAALEQQAELLRESRARVVAASDTERRRIERDLHDGAQQHLVALGLQASLARTLLRSDPAGAETALDKMQADVRRTQQEIRNLVRGLYPPALTQHGLASAIRAAVVDVEGPLRDDINDVGRHDPSVEAALYFCCIEALQNTLKHTPPSTVVTVSLRQESCGSTGAGELVLSVSDDGPGFATPDDHDGEGLTNLADRIGAIGGDLTVHSLPDAGTTVEARVATALPPPG